MSPEEEEKLLPLFTAEIISNDFEHTLVQFELTQLQCFFLLGQLQLALRHPSNTGAAAICGRRFAKRLQDAVSVAPTVAEIAERGWHE